MDEFETKALKAYKLQHPTITDFREDISRFGYIRRLISRWNKGSIRPRLLLNHLIILFNVFDHEFVRSHLRATYTDQGEWLIINTFLVRLGQTTNQSEIDGETWSEMEKDL